MGITERRQMEKELLRKKIIQAAVELLSEEGYESLSIRKIAKKIEYSPGIIYHYFKDKAEIMASIVEEGYGEIIKCISQIPIDMENPEKTLEHVLRSYIGLMIEKPQEFKAILMSDIESIQEKINILDEGISKRRGSMQELCKTIQAGIDNGKFRNIDTELTAQIIWASTHGLISRLVLERNIPEKQRERLINHHLEILINGLLKKE